MKKTVLLFSFLFFVSAIFAQSILFYDHDGNMIDNGSTIELLDEPTVGEILFEMNIQNSSDGEMNIYCKKIHVSVMDETMNVFCWGMCFGPDTYVSPSPLTIAAGETTADGIFSGHYMPGGVEGPTTVQYVFFDEANPNDSSYVTVRYVGGFTGLNNFENQVSEIYPNPATDYSTIDFNLNYNTSASIILTDLTGSRVKEISLEGNRGSAIIDVNDLYSGVYFYTIITDGQALKTGKLVVK